MENFHLCPKKSHRLHTKQPVSRFPEGTIMSLLRRSLTQSVLAFLLILCWGITKLCVASAGSLNPEPPTPPPPAPPMLSPNPQLARKASGVALTPWAPGSVLLSRALRPCGAGELALDLMAVLVFLGAIPSSTHRREPVVFPESQSPLWEECRLEWHARVFQSVGRLLGEQREAHWFVWEDPAFLHSVTEALGRCVLGGVR